MILILDNYDSFTYNLVQRLGEINPDIDLKVIRNDEATIDEVIALRPERIIISPGPCTPSEAGISVECVQQFAGKVPLLGVCLGHQSIGQAFGAKIVRAENLMHGKTDEIHHDGKDLFVGLDSPFIATRYHSLIIDPETLPGEFEVSAWTENSTVGREIMAVRHRTLPLWGLQFHPESFLTERGPEILQNFLSASCEKKDALA